MANPVGRPAKEYKRIQISLGMGWYDFLSDEKSKTGKSITAAIEEALCAHYDKDGQPGFKADALTP